MLPIFKCYFHVLFLYSCNFEFIKKKNWQIWCQFLNVVFMCFFCTRAILNLLKRKIHKYDANFWMLFSYAFLYSCNLEFIKKKNSQIWWQFLNVVFKCFFYIRAILNLLKRKIDKCGANFWNVAGMCYFRAKFM
jgi:hypothetical protein